MLTLPDPRSHVKPHDRTRHMQDLFEEVFGRWEIYDNIFGYLDTKDIKMVLASGSVLSIAANLHLDSKSEWRQVCEEEIVRTGLGSSARIYRVQSCWRWKSLVRVRSGETISSSSSRLYVEQRWGDPPGLAEWLGTEWDHWVFCVQYPVDIYLGKSDPWYCRRARPPPYTSVTVNYALGKLTSINPRYFSQIKGLYIKDSPVTPQRLLQVIGDLDYLEELEIYLIVHDPDLEEHEWLNGTSRRLSQLSVDTSSASTQLLHKILGTEMPNLTSLMTNVTGLKRSLLKCGHDIPLDSHATRLFYSRLPLLRNVSLNIDFTIDSSIAGSWLARHFPPTCCIKPGRNPIAMGMRNREHWLREIEEERARMFPRERGWWLVKTDAGLDPNQNS